MADKPVGSFFQSKRNMIIFSLVAIVLIIIATSSFFIFKNNTSNKSVAASNNVVCKIKIPKAFADKLTVTGEIPEKVKQDVMTENIVLMSKREAAPVSNIKLLSKMEVENYNCLPNDGFDVAKFQTSFDELSYLMKGRIESPNDKYLFISYEFTPSGGSPIHMVGFYWLTGTNFLYSTTFSEYAKPIPNVQSQVSAKPWGILEGTEDYKQFIKLVLIESYGEAKAKEVVKDAEFSDIPQETLDRATGVTENGATTFTGFKFKLENAQGWYFSSPLAEDISLIKATVATSNDLLAPNAPVGSTGWIFMDPNFSCVGNCDTVAQAASVSVKVNNVLKGMGINLQAVNKAGTPFFLLPKDKGGIIVNYKAGKGIYGFNLYINNQ